MGWKKIYSNPISNRYNGIRPYLEKGQPVAWTVKGYVIEQDVVYLIVGDDSGYEKWIHEKRASGTMEEARRKIT